MTPPPTTPCTSDRWRSRAGRPAVPRCQRGKLSAESSPAGRGPQSSEALPTRRLGHLSCLPVPPSLTVNNLLGSLSKINKNVLKFNLKNLALIIYFAVPESCRAFSDAPQTWCLWYNHCPHSYRPPLSGSPPGRPSRVVGLMSPQHLWAPRGRACLPQLCPWTSPAPPPGGRGAGKFWMWAAEQS